MTTQDRRPTKGKLGWHRGGVTKPMSKGDVERPGEEGKPADEKSPLDADPIFGDGRPAPQRPSDR